MIRMSKKSRKTENPYLPVEARVLSSERQSPDNFILTLSCKLEHEPGVFVQLYLPGVGECPISISSASGEHLELDIRQVGRVTNALAKLKKGDRVFVRGPYGKGYPMREFKGKNLFLIGGGCGVAPLKGILEYVERHRKDFKKVALFFGFRSPSDILFKKQLDGWKNKYDLNVSVDQDPSKTCYDWKVGFVTKVIEDSPFDGKNSVALLCGPPRMMETAIGLLEKKGFKDSQVFISSERLMYCAVGKCCHCMIRGKFTCMGGPVFRYDEIKGFKND